MTKPLSWSYGITTVTGRRADLLPRTLASLAAAGWDRPRLFVDGDNDPAGWEREFGLEVTCRYPVLRTFGNWALALWELFVRDGAADRYAIFQDDLACCRGLREYLDRNPYPEKGYWNLYRAPLTCLKGEPPAGWHQSAQKGIGALALVFSRDAVVALLTSNHFVERPIIRRPKDHQRWWRTIDGCVMDSFRKAGWKEYVHVPSLVEHTGMASTIRGLRPPEKWTGKEKLFMRSEGFPGETFDALSLLRREVSAS